MKEQIEIRIRFEKGELRGNKEAIMEYLDGNLLSCYLVAIYVNGKEVYSEPTAAKQLRITASNGEFCLHAHSIDAHDLLRWEIPVEFKFTETNENGNDFIADVRRSFLISQGFRQIEDSHLYKVDLPTDGTSLISDIHYNLWMEYWSDGKVDQSVGFGKYSTGDIIILLSVLHCT